MLGTTFIRKFESFIPLYLAEQKDPCGIQLGTLNKEIKKVMITLDIRPEVVKEAIFHHVDLIIAKHPLIFHPIKQIITDNPQSKMISDLLSHHIAVYIAHTNMDIVSNGLNDWFFERLSVKTKTFLKETHQLSYCHQVYEKNDQFKTIEPFLWDKEVKIKETKKTLTVVYPKQIKQEIEPLLSKMKPFFKETIETKKTFGIGRIGTLSHVTSLESFVKQVKSSFSLKHVTVIATNLQKEIQTIAICGGSGEKFYKNALQKHADVYITGDVYYHTGHDMLSDGLSVIDPGHYIESLCKEKLKAIFELWKKEKNWDVDFLISKENTNPFQII